MGDRNFQLCGNVSVKHQSRHVNSNVFKWKWPDISGMLNRCFRWTERKRHFYLVLHITNARFNLRFQFRSSNPAQVGNNFMELPVSEGQVPYMMHSQKNHCIPLFKKQTLSVLWVQGGRRLNEPLQVQACWQDEAEKLALLLSPVLWIKKEIYFLGLLHIYVSPITKDTYVLKLVCYIYFPLTLWPSAIPSQ